MGSNSDDGGHNKYIMNFTIPSPSLSTPSTLHQAPTIISPSAVLSSLLNSSVTRMSRNLDVFTGIHNLNLGQLDALLLKLRGKHALRASEKIVTKYQGSAFATSLYILAFLTTIYRIFVRIRIQRWGWDDTWAMLGTLSTVGTFILLWPSISEGMLLKFTHDGVGNVTLYRRISAFIQCGSCLGCRSSLSGYCVVRQCTCPFSVCSITENTHNRLGVLDFRSHRPSSASFRHHTTSSSVESSSACCYLWAVDCCLGRCINVDGT
jgi:hypothetical protein